MIFADKLIRLRKKSGWSQEELASRLDVSDSLCPSGKVRSRSRILRK